MIVGIDLGTSNSLVAVMTSGRPEPIPNALNELLTPSVVGIDERDRVLVGRAAKEFQVVHPERCASLFKRHMGSDWTTTLAGRRFKPEELSACVLRALKSDAEAYLGQPIVEAVISVPAYFSEPRRRATLRAGVLAGLRVERIINEPTAAAIAYGMHDAGENKTVLVYDLGGGTFDVSIVEVFDGVIEVRASSGECFLGGEDFSRIMAARVLHGAGAQLEYLEIESPVVLARLIQQCERAKCQLTTEREAIVAIPGSDGEIKADSRRKTVTREHFEEWTAHLIAQTEAPLLRCLADAKLTREQIDEVVLVGGATRMPAVVRQVGQWFNKMPASRLDPDLVVGLGAAVQAGLTSRNSAVDDLVVTDVAPFTLGIEIARDVGGDMRGGYYLPIIGRNTTIPCSRVERVGTVRANQNEVVVRVFQGDARRVEENLLLGELAVRGIPRGPSGQVIDIRFTYDLNGVLEVEATIVATGRRASTIIAKLASGMTPRQLEAAIARLAELKPTERDDYANDHLRKRAERVFRELPLDSRDELDAAITAFEAALHGGVPSEIVRQRDALQNLVDEFDADYFPGAENLG